MTPTLRTYSLMAVTPPATLIKNFGVILNLNGMSDLVSLIYSTMVSGSLTTPTKLIYSTVSSLKYSRPLAPHLDLRAERLTALPQTSLASPLTVTVSLNSYLILKKIRPPGQTAYPGNF